MEKPHAAPTRSRMSERYFGIDFAAHLPVQLGDVSLEYGSFEKDALPFLEEHYATLFGMEDPASARFLASPMTPAKMRFSEEMDVFVYRHAGRTVGVQMCHPTDWSSYYIRTTLILPDYRARGFMWSFTDWLVARLGDAGVERLEGDVCPTNVRMMSIGLKKGWVITSTNNSERWGTVVRFTQFIDNNARRIFERQFCAMTVKPAPRNPKPKGDRHEEVRELLLLSTEPSA